MIKALLIIWLIHPETGVAHRFQFDMASPQACVEKVEQIEPHVLAAECRGYYVGVVA